MALEPTAEQTDFIAAKLLHLFGTEAVDAIMAVEELWPLIRDMVLEAAAQECEQVPQPSADELACARSIRAMKGEPLTIRYVDDREATALLGQANAFLSLIYKDELEGRHVVELLAHALRMLYQAATPEFRRGMYAFLAENLAGDEGPRRMTNEHTLESLGTILAFDRERDAVHIAVIPVVAGEALASGRHVMLHDGKAYAKALPESAIVGVVDPFLHGGVGEGQRFWLFVLPCTITGLRHQWGHPAFPLQGPATTEEQQGESRRWLYKFAAENGVEYDELVEGAANGSGCTFHGTDQHGPLGNGEITVDATEFWRHVEVVTGLRFSTSHRNNTYFSCTC